MNKWLLMHLGVMTAMAGIITAMMVFAARVDDTRRPAATTVKTVNIPAGRPNDDLLHKLCPVKTPHTKPVSINIDSLKGSNWYSAVMAGIAHKSYFIVTVGDSANSSNVQQGVNATYRSSGLTLSAMQVPDELRKPADLTKKKHRLKNAAWQLHLSVDGLYADNKPAGTGTAATGITTDTSVVNFTTAGMTTQYVNTEAGVRQNFIVHQKPAANTTELRIKLHASQNWVVGKADDRELHFAQRNQHGGLDTKIIYKDLNVWDADGKKLSAKMEAGRDSRFDIVVASAGARYPVTIDPLATTAATTLTGPSSGSNFGFSAAGAGDVNGDGYSDVIVGAYLNGAAYVYYGSSTGLSTAAATTLNGTAISNFGYSVASAGDVNGDGYSDVIVGAYQASSLNGAVYIYHGSSTGLSAIAAKTIVGPSANSKFGWSVASAGDVNGDGYSDVIAGAYGVSSNTGAAYVYRGSPAGISSTAVTLLAGPSSNSYFGNSVAGAGDVNGDGYSDVVVGAYGVSSNTGAAYVYQGAVTGLSATATTVLAGVSTSSYFGFSVAGAGDVNGDGFGDVIAGAYGVSSNTGAAYVYQGAVTGLSAIAATVIAGVSTSSYFGYSVAGAGDVNGDGFGDVIAGAYGVSSNTGAAYVYLGSSAGLSATAATVFTGPSTNSGFGYSVAGGGDVNGDGYSDMIAGAFATANGNAYVYIGSTGSTQNTAATTLNGNGRFGYSIAGAGDVNGDGYSDVIVGAYGASSFTGAAYIYYGSSTGLSATAATTLIGTASSYFGVSVAGAGDVNGDGYSDVIVGAKGVSSSTGAAYIYLGSSTGISTIAATTLDGFSTNSYFGNSVASAGDVNGDGYSDVIVGAWAQTQLPYYYVKGAAYIYYGASSGISTTASTTLNGLLDGGDFGYSVACAGDVNGDGYSDVIVGAYGVAWSNNTQNGEAYVYYGSATGLSETADVTFSGTTNARFGICVASAGDVNGDGYSDVIIGAYQASGKGAAYVYHGASAGLSTTAATTFNGTANNGYFGDKVACAGDVNGDGYSDVMIGADGISSGKGAVYIYQGSSTGLSTTAALILNGTANNDQFGFGLAGVGDVDGDGYSDVIVGANNIATAKLYPGNGGYGKPNSILRLYNASLTFPLDPGNRAARQFGVGLFVRPFPGATKARLVWETEKEGVGFMHNSPITNYAGYTAAQSVYTTIPPAGIELKQLITKTGAATKFRVRVQYLSSLLPNGQVFGPWIYPQAYLSGAMPGVLFGLAGQPLPVNLLSFTAGKEAAGRNRINWATANEAAGISFEVTRSDDGIAFFGIGAIAGKGSAGGYIFYDDQPQPAATNYYRLKMTDAGGKVTYSNIAIVRNGNKVDGISISPVPATNTISITNTNTARNGEEVTIINMQGRIMLHFQLQALQHIDIKSWASGSYMLHCADGCVMRLMKQ